VDVWGIRKRAVGKGWRQTGRLLGVLRPDPEVYQQTKHDFEFVAHTREDVPWLRQIVRELLAQYAAMRGAIEEAIEEITYWHEDMLSEEERMHPRGSGWARVYDKLKASVQPDAGCDLLDRLRKLERVAERD